MKKVILSLAFVASLSAYAQKEGGSEKMNNVKVNVLSPIVKSGSFFYERKFNEKSSAQLGVGFTAYNKDDVKLSGFFFTPEYRFYLSNEKSAMEGFYLGPFLRYQNLKIEDVAAGDKATLSTFGGGVSIGRQWIFSDIVSLDLFGGPTYSSGTVKVTSGTDPDVPGGVSGFGVRVGVTVGVVF